MATGRDDESDPSSARSDHDQLTAAERVEKWLLQHGYGIDPVTATVDPTAPLTSDDNNEWDLDAASLLGYSDLRDFLLKGAEYEWLLRSLDLSLETAVEDTSRRKI